MEPLSRQTPATLDVLRALLSSDKPIWGLMIVKSTGRPSGSVYPILERLLELGWVTSDWEESDRLGARRRLYTLKTEAREAARAAVADATVRRQGAAARRPRLAGR